MIYLAKTKLPQQMGIVGAIDGPSVFGLPIWLLFKYEVGGDFCAGQVFPIQPLLDHGPRRCSILDWIDAYFIENEHCLGKSRTTPVFAS